VNHDFTVPADADGVRLDRFLVSVLAEHSRSQLQRLIKQGHVLVSGEPARANRALRAGQRVGVDVPEPGEPFPIPEEDTMPIE
jgi:23S rRNA pseudouridine1911/1915/1917 synthase